MIALVMTALVMFTPVNPTPNLGPNLEGVPVTEDGYLYRITSVAAGEARGIVGGIHAVVSTMRNRHTDWGQDLDAVLAAYYARPLEPTKEELVQAALAWAAPVPGVYYALSRQDVERMGADPDEAVMVLRHSRAKSLALYIYRDWPVGR